MPFGRKAITKICGLLGSVFVNRRWSSTSLVIALSVLSQTILRGFFKYRNPVAYRPQNPGALSEILLPPFRGEEISERGPANLKSAISALPEPFLM